MDGLRLCKLSVIEPVEGLSTLPLTMATQLLVLDLGIRVVYLRKYLDIVTHAQQRLP